MELATFAVCSNGHFNDPIDTWSLDISAPTPRFPFQSNLAMTWYQRTVSLKPRSRGFHLITREIVEGSPELAKIDVGLMHVFIQHTSASLTLNENADPDVRTDLETALATIAPEDAPYVHTCEGPDDMPAHIKSSLLGSSVTVPISNGGLALGTWQGIYLCEHRNRGGSRRVVVTIWGKGQAE